MFDKDFRARYLEALGIAPPEEVNSAGKKRDRTKAIEAAYRTAHRIREFEIELYWKRTAYIWAMQAAFIGIVAFLWTGGETVTQVEIVKHSLVLRSNTVSTPPYLLLILALSTLALVIAWLWRMLILGAKFWQNNWERHVDILGQELGENLYQVYPLENPEWSDTEIVPPFSVTRLNNYVVWAFLAFWFVNILSSLWNVSSIYADCCDLHLTLTFVFWVLIYLAVVVVPVCQFKHSKAFRGWRMGGNALGKVVYGSIDVRNAPVLMSRAFEERPK